MGKQIKRLNELPLGELMKIRSDGEAALSAEELSQVIEKLQRIKRRQDAVEDRKKRQEQKEREMRAAQEARERKESHVREVTSMELPLDWENVFQSDPRAQGVFAADAADGLILSLSNMGRVDIEYIAAVTGEDCKTVIRALKGSIYQNPDTWNECFYKGWETAEEYLSGNLRRKWRAAKQADREYNGYFSDNVAAIEKTLPPAARCEDIYVTLGSPWVPADIIDDFITHLFGRCQKLLTQPSLGPDDLKIKHDPITGAWEIPFKIVYNESVPATSTYGTRKMNAVHILERTLNMRPVAAMKEVACAANASGKKRVVNQEETILLQGKQKKLIKAFQRWVWKDEQRKTRLQTIFEEQFSCVSRRIFDGSFLRFPTMSPEVTLYPYQKNAAARILFTPNTLLAHDVGSGKTYIMIAAAMELRRMGLSAKNMFVVPNNLVGQWRDTFRTMYPQARVLCVEPKGFSPAKREDVLTRIRDEDLDGVIIAYSCFERIPLSKACYVQQLAEDRDKISQLAAQKNRVTAKLGKRMEAVKKALAELETAMDDLYDGIYFDELGITRLFVDEAHNFKNVPLETNIDHVLGVSANGSKKCRDMLDKVRTVQRQNNGGGVVFATGTPITNSVADAYVMQKYLQGGELTLLELQNFDSWVGMFAERNTEFEVDVDTNSFRLATRLSRFHNLPELTSLLAQVADFHQVDPSAGIPETDGYRDALIPKTQEFENYLWDISRRAELVRMGAVSRRDDNMLKITTDGRKAALDLRLVDPSASFSYQSKAARCAENAADIYFATGDSRSTQLIFCDTSTPKAGFNLYDELKNLLVQRGVRSEEIAYVHDAETDAQRETLFEKVRGGQVRVLLGSTFKLGLGVNIQDRLIALHHLDCPWRPADMTQREGRILRQGNRNRKVSIFRYITEGSFDAYSWQLLETKQRFIVDLLSGSFAARSAGDIESTVLSYAEVKALAVGNPLVKKRVEAVNELSQYRMLQKKSTESRTQLEVELLQLPGRIAVQEECVRNCAQDLSYYAQWKRENPQAADSKMKAGEDEQRRNLREHLHRALQAHTLEIREKTLLIYRGFGIVLPANMTQEKPYVWLRRRGSYRVELGDTAVGNLIRIDHCLDELSVYLEKCEKGLTALREREWQIRKELEHKEDFSGAIEQLQRRINQLDKQLGVKEI